MGSKLIFNYGTVSSSKSLNLLLMIFNYEKCGWSTVTIKPATDTRSEMIETRAHVPPRKADIIIGKDDSLYDYTGIVNSADVILVDECQFLSSTQIDELRNISIARDIDVICFGLRTDYHCHLFEASKRLFELADEVNEIKTICSICGKKAGFNSKVDLEISDNGDSVIPSWDAFEARCFNHFKDNK